MIFITIIAINIIMLKININVAEFCSYLRNVNTKIIPTDDNTSNIQKVKSNILLELKLSTLL